MRFHAGILEHHRGHYVEGACSVLCCVATESRAGIWLDGTARH